MIHGRPLGEGTFRERLGGLSQQLRLPASEIGNRAQRFNPLLLLQVRLTPQNLVVVRGFQREQPAVLQTHDRSATGLVGEQGLVPEGVPVLQGDQQPYVGQVHRPIGVAKFQLHVLGVGLGHLWYSDFPSVGRQLSIPHPPTLHRSPAGTHADAPAPWASCGAAAAPGGLIATSRCRARRSPVHARTLHGRSTQARHPPQLPPDLPLHLVLVALRVVTTDVCVGVLPQLRGLQEFVHADLAT
mmetsp:Transcript_58108/g.155320  ORF Transcript_58108/g.155320 Transcript_58108/m.155320 type:complete len:242 (-) Transcript_58108:368-1093(-)